MTTGETLAAGHSTLDHAGPSVSSKPAPQTAGLPEPSGPASKSANTRRRIRNRGTKKPQKTNDTVSKENTGTKNPPANSDAQKNSKPRPIAASGEGSEKGAERAQKTGPRKKSQRRSELDLLKRKFTVVNIDPETYQVILTPSDPDFALPLAVLDFDLVVPRHYPKETAKIIVNNREIPKGYALNVEQGFTRFQGTLAQRVGELDVELEDLLTSEPRRTVKIVRPVKKHPPRSTEPQHSVYTATKLPETTIPDHSSVKEPESVETEGDADEHVHDTSRSSDEMPDDRLGALTLDSDSEYEQSEPESEPDHESEEAEHANSGKLRGPARRGTELVLPDLSLSGISLLEVSSIRVLIRCGRCKHLNEVTNLMPGPYGHESKPRVQGCEKCSLGLMVAFRKEFLHSFSTTAGFFDISGGTFADLMPSAFLATCANCDETSSFKQVDFGKTSTTLCRNCHKKLSITLELFRFDVITTDTLGPAKPMAMPTNEITLKFAGGKPLPDNGTCRHYRKSQRWFRFSCCQRVFPCDRCHDSELDHPVELALRMVCGFCSREQRFSNVCVSCGHSFVIRNSGFWEGGKGTRDKAKMSRKDRRKYKRV